MRGLVRLLICILVLSGSAILAGAGPLAADDRQVVHTGSSVDEVERPNGDDQNGVDCPGHCPGLSERTVQLLPPHGTALPEDAVTSPASRPHGGNHRPPR